jgi:iron complex outermembrane recepter protein
MTGTRPRSESPGPLHGSLLPTSGRDGRSRPVRGALLSAMGVIFLAAGLGPTRAASGETDPASLGDLPLDQLLQLEVTSVSKQPEQLIDAPAAIFVLTRDDIRRSGYTTIPDLLRLVPGMQVGRLSSSLHAVGARGLASRFARDLLVLVDGRSIYTPAFSGVYWESQDLPFEDIERIEVIRGPGATLWGANAVNGVINIITRRAVDTPGGYVQAGTGTSQLGLAAARYGGRLGETAHYRIWSKGFQRDRMETSLQRDLGDAWGLTEGGFRMDWDRQPTQNFSFFGGLHRGDQGVRYDLPTLEYPFVTERSSSADLSGEYALARWQERPSLTSDLCLQTYVAHDIRGDNTYYDERTAFDLDLQHRLASPRRVAVIWGLGYRRTGVTLRGSDHVTLRGGRSRFTEHLVSAFIQNEVILVPERVNLTIGCKAEQKNGHEPEWQPNVRLLWHPGSRQTLWSAVSRAVRTPSLSETNSSLWVETVPPGGSEARNPLPVKLTYDGSEAMKSEHLTAWEAGYRVQPGVGLLVDFALFDMRYHDLRGTTIGDPQVVLDNGAYIQQPLILGNISTGWSRGAELVVDWYASPRLRLRASYSYLNLGIDQSDLADHETSFFEFSAPRNLAVTRASIEVAHGWELDLIGRYVDLDPRAGIPSYLVMDGSLAWRPVPSLEFRLSGMNFGAGTGHLESEYELDPDDRVLVEPDLFGSLTWAF